MKSGVIWNVSEIGGYMKKTVPEVVTYYCDSCGEVIKGSDKASNCKIKCHQMGLIIVVTL